MTRSNQTVSDYSDNVGMHDCTTAFCNSSNDLNDGSGEILASARIHMTAEFAALQQALSQRIAYMHASLLHKDIKVAVPDSTGPIFFVGLGSPNKSEKVWNILSQGLLWSKL